MARAKVSPPVSDPANSQFFRPTPTGRMERSATLRRDKQGESRIAAPELFLKIVPLHH